MDAKNRDLQMMLREYSKKAQIKFLIESRYLTIVYCGFEVRY